MRKDFAITSGEVKGRVGASTALRWQVVQRLGNGVADLTESQQGACAAHVPQGQQANRLYSSKVEAELHVPLTRFRSSLIYASLECSITFFNFSVLVFL